MAWFFNIFEMHENTWLVFLSFLKCLKIHGLVFYHFWNAWLHILTFFLAGAFFFANSKFHVCFFSKRCHAAFEFWNLVFRHAIQQRLSGNPKSDTPLQQAATSLAPPLDLTSSGGGVLSIFKRDSFAWKMQKYSMFFFDKIKALRDKKKSDARLSGVPCGTLAGPKSVPRNMAAGPFGSKSGAFWK